MACVLLGLVPADGAFLGFGHPAVVTVACVLVLSRGLLDSGAVDSLAHRLLPSSLGPVSGLVALTALGALLSAASGGLGITVGLGFYLPFNIVLTYSLGTLSRELADRFRGKDWSDNVGIPIAAGFIVGEALVGVGDAISKVIEGAMG